MLSCLLGAACAEAPAVRSRWNFQPRAKVVQTAVEAFHGPTDDTFLPPPCAAWSCSRDMSAMTTNVKQRPDRFNRITGPAAHAFRRSLVQRGGKPDDRGFTFADCFLREDEGALVPGTGVNGIPPIAQPGTVPIAEGADGTIARRAKIKRDKESATFIRQHLRLHFNEDLKHELDQPRFRENGPEVFDHIMTTRRQRLTAAENTEVKTELSRMYEFPLDISGENSVFLLVQVLRVIRLLLPHGSVTSDELAEYLLRSMALTPGADALLFLEAVAELGAPAGAIDAPDVRRFQTPPSAATVAAAAAAVPPRPPPPPTRDLARIAAHFHTLWRDSARSRDAPPYACQGPGLLRDPTPCRASEI